MKTVIRVLALTIVLCVLFGCNSAPSVNVTEDTEPEKNFSAETTVPTTVPSPPPTEEITEATEATAPPEHTELYIPGLAVEDVILYFNEVCLDAEFSTDGSDPSVVQKWVEPICYIIHGNYTEEDLITLYAINDWLNTIEGFPGIYETQDPGQANLQIHFCGESEMLALMGDQFIGTDGCVTFWYLDNEIYDATICYRTDLDQQVRNSVILEEIYNGLGPVQDTDLREDSIIYAGYSTPQELTDVDRLILQLLYHPDMLCGMDAESCEQVIRQLYY